MLWQNKYFTPVLFIGLVIALFLSTPMILLFYDAPEYVDIVTENSFLDSIQKGHLPIHPVFIGFLWIMVRSINALFNIPPEYAGNISALVSGIITIIAFYKLTQLFFPRVMYRNLALIIFLFFPVIWIINSNLMVESIILPFFIGAVYYFNMFLNQRRVLHALLYLLLVFFLIGSHIQTIFWLPSIFGILLILRKSYYLNDLIDYLFLTTIGFFMGFCLYAIIYFLHGKDVSSLLFDLFFAHSGTIAYQGITDHLRSTRNLFLNTARSFGSLSLFLIAYFLLQDLNNKKNLIGWGLIILSLAVEGLIWTGDFMQRRLVFFGVILAILIVKRLEKKAVVVIFYLFLILIPNIILYSTNKQNMPLYQLEHVANITPRDEVYLQSNYVSPFVHNYDGKLVWVDGSNPVMVAELLQNNRVFIDSQGMRSPYYVYTGNNYHITSLAKVGESPAKSIVAENNLCFYSNYGEIVVYEIKKPGEQCEYEFQLEQKITPGEPIIFNSTIPLQRVNRRRIDYGDIFTWGWYLLTDKSDALDWIYADVDGDVIYPIN